MLFFFHTHCDISISYLKIYICARVVEILVYYTYLDYRFMSSKKDSKTSNAIVSQPQNSDQPSCQIRLYYVRFQEKKDELSVEAVFANNIRFSFNNYMVLDGGKQCNSVIYMANITVQIYDEEELLIAHDAEWKNIGKGQFRLEISHKMFIKTLTYKEKEKGLMERSLISYVNNKHYFLFDIHFSSAYTTHLPGKNVFIPKYIFINEMLFT